MELLVVVETNGPDTIECKLTDNSNNELSHAKVQTADSGQSKQALAIRRHLTVTSETTYKLRARSTVTTSKVLTAATGGTKADWQRIDFV
jgi:hypothetical protein